MNMIKRKSTGLAAFCIVTAFLYVAISGAPAASAASRERYGNKYYFSATVKSSYSAPGTPAAGKISRRRVLVDYFHKPLVLFLEADRDSKATIEIAVTDIGSIRVFHATDNEFVSVKITTDGGTVQEGYFPSETGFSAIRAADIHSRSPVRVFIRISVVEEIEFATKKGDLKDTHNYESKANKAAKRTAHPKEKDPGVDTKEKPIEEKLDEIEATMNRTMLVDVRQKLRELEQECGGHYRIDYLLARAYLRKGDVEKTKERLGKSLATEPGYVPALFLKLIIAYKIGLYTACIDEAAAILKLEPERRIELEIMYIAAHSCLRTGKLARANRMASDMLKIEEDPRAYAMLGHVQVRFEKWDNARNYYEKAFACGKGKYVDRASIHTNLGALDEIDALEFERKIGILKEAGDNQSAELNYFKARGKYRSAAEHYKKALRDNYFLKEAELNLKRLEDSGKVIPENTEN